MEENAFTADGFSPFEERRDQQEREGRLMMICSEKSAIPRKKRSSRVGIFKEERMTCESPLEFLASVAVKWSELNDRLPLKKRKIEFLFPTEQNRKKTKRSLNLVATEAMQLKKERDEFGVFEESVLGEFPYGILLSFASEPWELNQKLPFKKREREFSSQIAEIPKVNKKKKTLNSKATEKKQKNDNPAILTVPPMAEAMAEKIRGMGGERVEFVIEKQLRQTDLNKGNSRLSIPLRQTRTDFLSETEKTILSQRMENQKSMRGIEVIVIDPRLEELNLCLKMWKMSNNFVYNLIGNWNKLVAENKLQEDHTVQLWAFRVEERRRRGLSDLCFALAKVEDDNNGGAVDNDSSTSTSTVTTQDQD